MKSTFIALSALIISAQALASPDEEVVSAYARQSHLTPAEIREHYNHCDSGITLTMKICGGYRFTVQDVRLNKAYASARAVLKKLGTEVALVKAQRSWLTYRDTFCALEGQMEAGGGTAEGLYVIACKEGLTRQQAERLEALVQSQGPR